MVRKNIFAISGSTRKNSSNEFILKFIAESHKEDFQVEIFDEIASLPHFSPDLDNENVPEVVKDFRRKIQEADGVIICTPEYVFSLPGSLKNALEWTVSTTVFTDKPTAIIVAAASGEKAHESLILVMRTIQAQVKDEATLLIKGVKGKFDEKGNLKDENCRLQLKKLTEALIAQIEK